MTTASKLEDITTAILAQGQYDLEYDNYLGKNIHNLPALAYIDMHDVISEAAAHGLDPVVVFEAIMKGA